MHTAIKITEYFNASSVTSTEGPMTSVVDWIYCIFSPLSTLGYGDTIAAGRKSGMLAIGEAISGQLLLAVPIAFGRYASGHTQHS